MEKTMSNKKWFIIAPVAAIILALGLSSCGTTYLLPDGSANGYFPSQQNGIWVSGNSKVTVTPDLAVLAMGVQT